MKLQLFDTHEIQLHGITENDYEKIVNKLRNLIQKSKVKNRDAIAETFVYAIDLCPKANLSDIWHHIIYRKYIEIKGGTRPGQSWVRTSGEAFEQAICDIYNPLLQEKNIRLLPLFSRKQKEAALERLGIAGQIGSSKVDILVESKNSGKNPLLDGYGVIGGLHCKVSLAERVSDDIPASRIMMEEGLLSVLITLDVKSFPPPHGDLVNRGELGSPENPSDKRKYIENHGDFDACFSYNKRTIPSEMGKETPSGKRIYVVDLIGLEDELVTFLKKFCD